MARGARVHEGRVIKTEEVGKRRKKDCQEEGWRKRKIRECKKSARMRNGARSKGSWRKSKKE